MHCDGKEKRPVCTNMEGLGSSNTYSNSAPAKAVNNNSNSKKKQLNDIRAIMERLSKLANELSITANRPTIHSTINSSGKLPFYCTINDQLDPTGANLCGNDQNGTTQLADSSAVKMVNISNMGLGIGTTLSNPPIVLNRAPSTDVQALRIQVRDIARQVTKFEELIRINDSTLNDIRSDLCQRLRQIKVVLCDDDDQDDTNTSLIEPEPSQSKQEEVVEANEDETCSGYSDPGPPSEFLEVMEELAVTESRSPASAASAEVKSWARASEGRNNNEVVFTAATASINGNIQKILVMTNKSPMWNEQSQVYQLDFNGRVTQESAKNFQIEFEQRQVLQFGRIENGAFTLDFVEPFSAIQAFGIALASITQRLK